jgi:hypothetical protein
VDETEVRLESRPQKHALPIRILPKPSAAQTRSDSAYGIQNTSDLDPSLHDTMGPLSPERIFDCLLNSILQLIEAPFLGFAILFITGMTPHEHLLLFCSSSELKTMDLYGEINFTEDQINSIKRVYKNYTGVCISDVKNTLTELLVSLLFPKHLFLTNVGTPSLPNSRRTIHDRTNKRNSQQRKIQTAQHSSFYSRPYPSRLGGLSCIDTPYITLQNLPGSKPEGLGTSWDRVLYHG